MESGRDKTGTSLLEILVVIAIIVILAGLIGVVGKGVESGSKTRAVKATFALLESALDEYYDSTGRFPAAGDPNNPYVNCEILYSALNSLPASREVLEKISEKVIRNRFNPTVVPPVYEIYDLWGTVLDYRYEPGESFPKLISAGPDKNHLTAEDNITNR
ncbi:MAG: hypothetical protein JW720_12065 [Sedimentisphaerales bacterium]|nr:hypothetical protein [Sedimentisphaerales bacterium]